MLNSIFITGLLFALFATTCGKSIEQTSRQQQWHIHVTMHVFSGRPDPTWKILDSHPTYKTILRNIGTIPTKPFPNKLGYRGFSLIHVVPGHDFTKGGALNQTVTQFSDWELLILDTADEYVSMELKDHAKDAIVQMNVNQADETTYLNIPLKRRRRYYHVQQSQNILNDKKYASNYGNYGDFYNKYLHYMKTTTPDPLEGLSMANIVVLEKALGVNNGINYNKLNITTTPTPIGPTRYEPAKWNRYAIKRTNNCYNYANNEITDTMAQPGKAHNCIFPTVNPTGSHVEKSSICDGLKPLTAPGPRTLPKHDLNLVALVFWPPKTVDGEWDFHWYRLDNNQRFSHKPGQTAATNVDQKGRHITDPRYAARGPYTEFVGFMETMTNRVTVL